MQFESCYDIWNPFSIRYMNASRLYHAAPLLKWAYTWLSGHKCHRFDMIPDGEVDIFVSLCCN